MAKRRDPDDKFLKTARSRWKLGSDSQQKQRQREVDDLSFYAGNQWPADLLTARDGQNVNGQVVPARPSLVINKTIEPVRQILNQERQADLGYELIPADDFGEVTGPIDHTEIELREGLVRRIQRDSEAEDARTWAFQRAAIAGRGYRRVNTRYLPGKRADQEIYIERIYDQTSVILDPSHEQPDGSDAEWAFDGQDMLWDAFKSEYPNAKAADAESDKEWRTLVDSIPDWFTGGESDKHPRSVRVMNYYYAERESKKIYHLTNGAGAYDDELTEAVEGQPRALLTDPSITVVQDEDGGEMSHVETTRQIKWAKIVGNEVLDRTDWPGRWIPIIEEVGEELQPFDQERRFQGVVRPMRDSCKGNNYIISKFVEYTGLQPIPPWIMAGGQDEGFQAEWQAANTRALATLHYNQTDQFDRPAPPPQRTDVRTDMSGMAMGVQIFGQAISSTSAVPETALGNTDATVKSGKLARALIEQGNQSTSNFMDNHKRSLRHEARVVNDLLYPIYGRPGRLLKTVDGQGQIQSIILGQPFTLEGDGKHKKPVPVKGWTEGQPIPPNAKLYKLTQDADFNIAVKVTKSIETRRQQIVQFLGELISSSPEQMQIIGDKLFKYMDVPDHADMEERYRLMLAPPIQQLLSGQSPLPPEAMQKIAMLEQQLAEVMPLADKNKSDLMKTEMTEKAESEREAARLASEQQLERMKLEAQYTIEAMKLGSAEAMKRAEIDAQMLHAHNDAQMAAQTQTADAEQAERDRQAAAAEQANAQGFEADQNAEDRALQVEQAQLSHQQQLEQQAQQAALQPPPDAAQ